MQKPAPGLLVFCGAAIAAAISYDAYVVAELIGMSRYGGEGIVAVTGLGLSSLFIAFGAHGLVRRRVLVSSRTAA